MKILFQSRVDLFDKPGGDTVQINETKKALEKLGIIVDINNSLNVNASKYDIVHIFNLDWVCEAYWYIKNAKKYKKPVVLSPIHHSLKEFKRYENEYRWGLAKFGNFLIPIQSLRDSFRNLAKAIIDKRKLKPAIFQILFGIRRQQRKAIEKSDYILVQTNREASDLNKAYRPNRKFMWKKVVNGVNAEKFSNPNFKEATKILRFKKYIFCVGRIEPRKNQLNLIKALVDLKKTNPNFKDINLVFAGSLNNHHPTYVNAFKKYLNKYSFLQYLGFVDQTVLAAVYSKATIFAVPSWFETTGLVYLEAVVAGCKSIVASGGRAYEYLEHNGYYCDPGSVFSISKTLIKAHKHKSVSAKFKQKVLKNYNWDITARQTLKVYLKTLENNNY